MQKLRIEIGDDAYKFRVPSSFAEMTGEQLLAAASVMMNAEDDDPLRILCGMDEELFAKLSRYQRYAIRGMFDFVLRVEPEKLSFKEWKLPTIDADGEVWYGPIGNFGNMAWGEFVYVDQCMIQGLHRAAVAAMFRQQRKDYDGETDIRVPFSTYGTTNRYKRMGDIPESCIMAVVLNYRAMRNASLEQYYTEIFPYKVSRNEVAEDEVDDTPEEDVSVQTKTFSWTTVHRNLIGENIQDEDKFLNLNVHTVLYRLNQVIADSKKKKH